VDLGRARYLVSERGGRDLAGLPEGLAELPPTALATRLRREYAPPEASALAEQVTHRARARRRFGTHGDLLFTREGLEMMTHPAVAARRAGRLAEAGARIVDATCGLGGDLRACSWGATAAVGFDHDPVAALLAARNVPSASVARADATRLPIEVRGVALLLDPQRRGERGRRFDPAAFSPAWDECLALGAAARIASLKGPPGLPHAQVPPAAEVEFVQVGRSLREATVWLDGAGRERADGRPLRRAVLLPQEAILASTEPEASATCQAPSAVVFDPEGCVTRAGLVRHLGARLSASLLDPQVAYLTAEHAAHDPLASTFAVLDVAPFSVARLRTRLRERGWRPEEIRRRAFPVEPDELRRLLGRLEGDPVTLLCTTIQDRRTVIIARRLRAPESSEAPLVPGVARQ